MQNLSVQSCLEGNNCVSWDVTVCNTRWLTGTKGREKSYIHVNTHTHYLFAYLFNILCLSLISPKEEPRTILSASNLLGSIHDPKEQG